MAVKPVTVKAPLMSKKPKTAVTNGTGGGGGRSTGAQKGNSKTPRSKSSPHAVATSSSTSSDPGASAISPPQTTITKSKSTLGTARTNVGGEQTSAYEYSDDFDLTSDDFEPTPPTRGVGVVDQYYQYDDRVYTTTHNPNNVGYSGLPGRHVPLDKTYATDYKPNTTNFCATKHPSSHRAYVSLNPTCNKLLAKKWDQHNRKLHLEKLKRTKPTIDNAPPKIYKHLEVNMRKIQNEEARIAEIEHHNIVLVEKMADIMKATAHAYDYSNRNEPDSEYLQNLHMARRQREMEKINKANLEMLVRLENKGANYSHEQWENDRNKNLYYLRNISSFPRKYVDEADRLWKAYRPASPTGAASPATAAAPTTAATTTTAGGGARKDRLPDINNRRATLTSSNSIAEEKTKSVASLVGEKRQGGGGSAGGSSTPPSQQQQQQDHQQLQQPSDRMSERGSQRSAASATLITPAAAAAARSTGNLNSKNNTTSSTIDKSSSAYSLSDKPSAQSILHMAAKEKLPASMASLHRSGSKSRTGSTAKIHFQDE